MTKNQKRNANKRNGMSHIKRKLFRAFLMAFNLPVGVKPVTVETVPTVSKRVRKPLSDAQKLARNLKRRKSAIQPSL